MQLARKVDKRQKSYELDESKNWGSPYRLSIARSPRHLIVERHIVIGKGKFNLRQGWHSFHQPRHRLNGSDKPSIQLVRGCDEERRRVSLVVDERKAKSVPVCAGVHPYILRT